MMASNAGSAMVISHASDSHATTEAIAATGSNATTTGPNAATSGANATTGTHAAKEPKATTEAIATQVNEDEETAEAPKTYYNKRSVWLMILYSGLAIGSDGL